MSGCGDGGGPVGSAAEGVMVVDLPERIRPRFIAAGWFPGRRVAVSAAVPTDHPAAAVLAAFGGLTVAPDRKGGEECESGRLGVPRTVAG